jgi:hypothetical protein
VTEKVASGETWSFLKSGATDLWNKASSAVAEVVAVPPASDGNIFGITPDRFKQQGGGSGDGNVSAAIRASPTNFRSNASSPTQQSAEDLAAIQAIKNMNLDAPVSRNSSSNSLSGGSGRASRSSSTSSLNASGQPQSTKTALAPAGDDFFASFGAK